MSESVAAPPPRWAVVTWALLIFSLIGLFAFAGTYGSKRQEAELRHLLFANTAQPFDRLADCIARRFPLTGRGWDAVGSGHYRRWNNARGVMVEIFDRGNGRRLEISTPGGRALRDQEAEALRRCLAGH